MRGDTNLWCISAALSGAPQSEGSLRVVSVQALHASGDAVSAKEAQDAVPVVLIRYAALSHGPIPNPGMHCATWLAISVSCV